MSRELVSREPATTAGRLDRFAQLERDWVRRAPDPVGIRVR